MKLLVSVTLRGTHAGILRLTSMESGCMKLHMGSFYIHSINTLK